MRADAGAHPFQKQEERGFYWNKTLDRDKTPNMVVSHNWFMVAYQQQGFLHHTLPGRIRHCALMTFRPSRGSPKSDSPIHPVRRPLLEYENVTV